MKKTLECHTTTGTGPSHTTQPATGDLRRFSHSLDAGRLLNDERHGAEAPTPALHLRHGVFSLGGRRRRRSRHHSRRWGHRLPRCSRRRTETGHRLPRCSRSRTETETETARCRRGRTTAERTRSTRSSAIPASRTEYAAGRRRPRRLTTTAPEQKTATAVARAKSILQSSPSCPDLQKKTKCCLRMYLQQASRRRHDADGCVRLKSKLF